MAGTMSTEERQADLAASKQAIAEVSDADLYNSAVADETVLQDQGTDAQPEKVENKEDATGRLHGADGKFAPKAKDADAAPTQQQPTEQAQPKADEDGAQVPSWRLKELREERDAVRLQAQEFERSYAETQRQLREAQAQLRKQAEPPKPPPSVFEDPDGYTAHVESTMEQRLRNMEANFSFRLAHSQHKDVFEQAYQDMINRAERGDPSVVQSIMRSPDPGSTLVNWYQREQTLAKVGNDPDAWFQKQLDERLKDPKYQGEVLERIRGSASQTPANNGSAPKVVLPPSLNRVASAARAAGDDEGDLSDASLYRHATR